MGEDALDMTFAIVLAPRSVRYTRAAFQRHYEEYHAPLFYSFGKVGVGRYLRNHIVGFEGGDPPFDTISEFGNYPAKRDRLIAALRSPEARKLEEDVHDFLAERGNTFAISETLIAGPPRGFEAGPVRKRRLLMRKAAGSSADDVARVAHDYAASVAGKLVSRAERVTLTLWKPDPAPPMDAMLTVWPASGDLRPALPAPPSPLVRAYLLDVDAYCTAWQD